MNVFAKFDEIPSMTLQDIKDSSTVNANTKAILKNYKGKYQALIILAPSTYFFIISICLVDMNVYARFDEIPPMTLKDIKKIKCYGWADSKSFILRAGIPDLIKAATSPPCILTVPPLKIIAVCFKILSRNDESILVSEINRT